MAREAFSQRARPSIQAIGLTEQQWRVIRAEDANFPAFYRVVWRAHVAEWSDLSLAGQAAMMGAVGASVEMPEVPGLRLSLILKPLYFAGL